MSNHTNIITPKARRATQVIRPRTRAEWLDIRRSGIGSSEVATIVGLNPWETPYRLWRRKRGLDPAKEETFAMRAGHYLEDAVSRFWMDETGRSVIKASAGDWIIRDAERPYLQVSPDRTYWLGESRAPEAKGILECKTTQATVEADDLPRHWFAQVQYQLGVAGLEHGSIAWLSAGRTFGWTDIELVPDFFGWLVEEVERFWRDCIEGGREPELTTAADVMAKYARHTDGKAAEADERAYAMYRKTKELSERIAEMELERDAMEDALRVQMADAETLTFGGQTLATWRTSRPSERLDAKALRADHPELARQYTVQTAGTRRFVLK